ncbi:MAG: eCIS core domain-containing protein [Mucilaginibacter sp.]
MFLLFEVAYFYAFTIDLYSLVLFYFNQLKVNKLNATKQPGKIDEQKNHLPLNSSFFQARTVSSRPPFFQPKLTIGPVDDPYEREADAVADKIVGMPDTQVSSNNSFSTSNVSSTIQRKCAHCEEEEKLQRKAEGDATGGLDAPSIVHEVTSSGGQPLDSGTRSFFEPRFGHDLSQVRVHTDDRAAESAKEVQAHAYTVGNHVVFGSNQFDPASSGGQRLLAHELTHTIQQSPADHPVLQSRLKAGAIDTPAENEAERAAERVATGPVGPITPINSTQIISRQVADFPADSGMKAEPDFKSPQKRGGQPRAAFVPAPPEGDDQVRIAVTRYLCNCKLSSFTDKHATGQLLPNPGFSLEFCRGVFTARLKGNIEPQEKDAVLSGEINISPGSSGVGVKIGTDGKVSVDGTEPTVGGSGSINVGKPGGVQGGAQVDLTHGLNTGKTGVDVTGGVNLGDNGTSIGLKVGDVQDKNRTYSIVFGTTIGKEVEKKTCRQCKCPSVYCCMKDIQPRDYEVPHTFDVEDTAPLRYYFSLDSDRETTDPTLKTLSNQMPDEVAKRLQGGAKLRSIVGYASPEDNRDRPVPNEQLSMSRAKKLRDLLVAKLGPRNDMPEPQAGGELLGRTATVLPGSGLSDAIVDAGFNGPEEFNSFLIGTDIPNPKLADQFLALLNNEKLKDPAARLSLFGIDASSPAAPRLLAAIDRFIASKGRGPRPWENIFAFLRFATVQLVTTHQETSMEQKHTSGSLTPITDDSLCNSYAYDAEAKGLFGPAQKDPESEDDCEKGQSAPAQGAEDKNAPACSPGNLEKKCDYSS